uniref:Serglycin n=1 Tax=Nothobranchius korthausae TaxID=1143690 RepID=A0A1A8H8D6_9TELE
MKVFLLLFVTCISLHNGKGAPTTAKYQFVRCSPEGGQANCVTYQSSDIPWSPDLPKKLPASVGRTLDATPVEDESPLREEEENKEETLFGSDDKESPDVFLGDEGSGDYEGSASQGLYFADRTLAAEVDTGSGESWTGSFPDENLNNFFADEAKPSEHDLKEDHLLNL